MGEQQTTPRGMADAPGGGGLTWSDTLEKIAPAFVAVQQEVEDPPRSGHNPHYGSSYVTLEDLIHAVRPVLSEHGVTLIQAPGMEDGRVTVETLLLHESGEWVRSTARSPAQRADPQGVGSAITYLRRYSLAAMLGIAHEADDDANRATGEPDGSRSRPSEKRENASGDDGHTCIDLDAEVGFGKHEKLTWREVAVEHPGYIKWWSDKEDQDVLCDDCLEGLRTTYREATGGGGEKGESGAKAAESPATQWIRLWERHRPEKGAKARREWETDTLLAKLDDVPTTGDDLVDHNELASEHYETLADALMDEVEKASQTEIPA